MAKKAKAKSSYLVFISHAEKDRWIAKQMEQLLNRAKRGGK
jgi:hypothetical protein